MSERETPQVQEDPAETAQETDGISSGPASESPKDMWDDVFQELGDIEKKDRLKSDYGPEVHVHYNIYQGNYVNNTGTIGGIDQRQGSAAGGPAEPAKGANACVRSFFQPDTRFDALAALITLATFQMVPEAVFHELAQGLRDRLTAQAGVEEQEAPAAFWTAEELLAPFQIQYIDDPAVQDPNALRSLCLVFRDQNDAGQIRKQIWRDYPQLRGTLTRWLLGLRRRTAAAVDRRMGYAAMQGLACYASLDQAYARDTLAPFLEQDCTAQADVKYLAVFFKQLMQWEDSGRLADLLLCRWCERRNGILWQVPYRLCGQDGDWEFQNRAPRVLETHLKWDLLQQTASFLDWYKRDRGYLLRPAHENARAAELLAEGLARCFAESGDHGGRRRAAIYFLALFRWDYLTDFSDEPNLVFLGCLHQKKTRAALLPLFQFIWQSEELRGTARQVLECHMREIGLYGAPCAYLEKPFEYLAFTGKKTDYNNTLYLLKKCARQEDARPAAQYLIDHLTARLQGRRADSTRTRKA